MDTCGSGTLIQWEIQCGLSKNKVRVMSQGGIPDWKGPGNGRMDTDLPRRALYPPPPLRFGLLPGSRLCNGKLGCGLSFYLNEFR